MIIDDAEKSGSGTIVRFATGATVDRTWLTRLFFMPL